MSTASEGSTSDSPPSPDKTIYGYATLLNVNTICSSLSLVGAMVMIIPFLAKRRLRKLRHKLIFCLAINDACLALTTFVPTIRAQIGHELIDDSPGCKADAFFYLTFLIAACCWALSIAGSTYVVVVLPLSNAARWLHHSMAIPAFATLIWSACIVNAMFGVLFEDTIDIGGVCFFPSSRGKLYGNLVVFIPRTVTFTAIVSIYIKLYLFLRRQGKQSIEADSYDLDAAIHIVQTKAESSAQLTSSAEEVKETLPNKLESDLQPPLSHPQEANPGSPASTFTAVTYQTQYGRKLSRDSQHTLADFVARVHPVLPSPVAEDSPAAERPADPSMCAQTRLSHSLSCSSISTQSEASHSVPTRRAHHSMDITEALATVVPESPSTTLQSTSPNRLSPAERNRRVAYLMMLYPIAYSAIMAISLGRILSTLITGVRSAARVSLLNRILVLSMGAIDAVIYTIIEWRFRASAQAAGSR